MACCVPSDRAAGELSAAHAQELAPRSCASADAGTLDEGTARLVTASLGFGAQTAADVMTPRSWTVSVDRTVSAAEVALARKTGPRASPCSARDWDDVTGGRAREGAIAVPYERRAAVPVSALMVDPVIVPRRSAWIRSSRRCAQGLQFARRGGRVRRDFGSSPWDVVEEIVEMSATNTTAARPRGVDSSTARGPSRGCGVPTSAQPDQGGCRTDRHTDRRGYVVSRPQAGARGRGRSARRRGWRLAVADMEGRRVDRLRLIRCRRTAPRPMTRTRGVCREHRPLGDRHPSAAQRLLRRGRVRGRWRPGAVNSAAGDGGATGDAATCLQAR